MTIGNGFLTTSDPATGPFSWWTDAMEISCRLKIWVTLKHPGRSRAEAQVVPEERAFQIHDCQFLLRRRTDVGHPSGRRQPPGAGYDVETTALARR